MLIDLKSAFERVEKDLSHIPAAAHKALQLTLNETARKGRTLLDREIRAHYAIKQRVKGSDSKGSLASLQPVLASANRLQAGIKATSPMNPLIEFGVKPASPKPGKPISVQVAKTGFKQVARDGEPAFVAQMPSGHTGVFARVPDKYMAKKGKRGGKREAIRELYAIGTPFMLNAERLGDDKHKELLDYFNQRLEHHIALALSGEGPYKGLTE